MNNRKQNLQLAYLRESFSSFLKEKLSQSKVVPAINEAVSGMQGIQQEGEIPPFRKLCQALGLTREEFLQTYLEPWRSLTGEQAKAVTRYINLALVPERALLLEAIPINEHRALHWTMVNIYECSLFEVFLPDYVTEHEKANPDLITQAFTAPEYSLPYKQCCYCGRLKKDPRGRSFGAKSLKLCHVSGCPSNSEPSEHAQGCCFKEWEPLKENLRKRLKNNNNPANDIKVFRQFCEKRFQENLKIQTPVQVQNERPREWATPFDSLSFTVHEEGKLPHRQNSLPLY